MKISKTYNRVYNKLATNSAYRDNDKLLILSVWREEGLHLTPIQEHHFMSVTSPETIRRTRQKIQEQGNFPSSKKFFKARRDLEFETKSEIITDKKGNTDLYGYFNV